MHSFGQYQQTGRLQQASQAAPHPPHDGTSALSANNSYQYMIINSGVQPSQSANVALQNGSYVDRQLGAKRMQKNDVDIRNPLLKMLLLERKDLWNLQNENSSLPDTRGPQAPTQQIFCQYSTNQNLSNATSPNTTYPRQDQTVPWTQPIPVNNRQIVKSVNVSHIQQYVTSQSFCQTANKVTAKPLSPYTAATPPLQQQQQQQQMVNPNTLMSAGSQNVQISQVAPNQFGQNSTDGRFASTYQSSWGMVASQPFGKKSVSLQSYSNEQVSYILNSSQTLQQPTTHPCSSYNNWGKPDNPRSANMMNLSNSNFSMVKTNEVPFNPAGRTQQMLRHHVSADSLSNSLPPPYDSIHFYSVPQTSKQNVQPVTSARPERCNFNATQPVSLHTGQSLPQSAMMSRGQFTQNCPPRQQISPKDTRIISKRDEHKQKTATDPPNNSMISKECPVVLPSLCSPVKQNDNSSHSMLGHASTKAVAVVPPLSQEKENTFSNTTLCESAEKTCITPDLLKGAENACLREESDLNKNISNLIEASKTDNRGAVLTTSNSESPAHKPPEGPASETYPKEQMPASPPVLGLSSLPTNAWTTEALNKLILETEQAQPKPKENSHPSIAIKLLITVWNKNVRALLEYLKARQSGFTLEFEKPRIDIFDKSVILTEVKPDFKDYLKHYHVLVDGEVYSEQPYKSLWLNVNHQLDDIDKEFGFPWSLKQHLYVPETDGQIDPLKTQSSIPEPVVHEVHNKVLSQTESETVDRVEEKVSAVECSPPPPAAQSESEDSSSDLDHTFKIEVLPPEAAKSIFEQVQKRTSQSTDCENATVSSGSSQTGTTKDVDPLLKTDRVENKSNDKIKEICCLAKFLEMSSISDVPFSKCKCNVEQSYNGQTVKSPKPHPDSSAKSKAVTQCQTITLSASELCSKLGQIIDLTDEDDTSQESEVDPDQETEIISQISTGSLLNVVTKSENENNDVSPIDFVITSSPFTLEISETESEDNSPPDEIESSGSKPSNTSVSSAKQTESDQFCTTEAENVLEMSDQRENCEQAHLKSTEEAESPLESERQTQMTYFSHNGKEKPTEKKHRQSSLDHFFPGLKTTKCKRRKDRDSDDPEAQPEASEIKTVELVLFGSGQKRQGFIHESEKNRPPEVLSVNMNPSRRTSLEANCPKKYSVKQLIYERWRSTFPPTLSGSIFKGFRNKLKRPKRVSAPLPSPSSTTHWSAPPEVQVPDRLSKNRLSLKRRRSFSLIRRLEKVKRRRYSVTLEQPANRDESETQNGNLNTMPLRENIVLKFSVLPNTFHFKDGSGKMKETSDSVSDMPELDDKNQSLKMTVGKSKVGAWCPATEKQNQPLRDPQAVSLFHEYQKKYKEKTHISADESSDK